MAERSNKRLCASEERDDAESFVPRDYQIEILETAKQKNTIACLGTGTGKTFIAIMLMRENAVNVRQPFSAGGKRIFFLVPTVPLVNQQKKSIEVHTDLKVAGYFGEMNTDSWNKEKWEEQFTENEVLVMTAEIFRIILEHAFISPRQIQLLIFDECHRAQGEHPYRQAMRYLHDAHQELRPRIFALSASLLNGKCKPNQLEKRLKELESTMLSSITTASDIADLKQYGTDPDEYVVYYADYKTSAAELLDKVKKYMQSLKTFTYDSCPEVEDDIVFFDKPIKCLKSLGEVLSTLGPWCAFKAAEIYKEEVKKLWLHPSMDKHYDVFKNICSFLQDFMNSCITLNGGSLEIGTIPLPSKLERLTELFVAATKSARFSDKTTHSIDFTFGENPLKYHQLQKENKSKSGLNICSIIFVQQRITAYVLTQWLLKVREKYTVLDFMRPDFIVGHGSLGLSEVSMSEKTQRNKVKAFREQKCNVLVATCVLEEGMDIRQCNIIVRFDSLGDFRSYVQSKGRARAANSVYVMMVKEGLDTYTFLQDMCNFKTIEKLLLSRCINRTEPTDEDIADNMADQDIPSYMPFGTHGPRITMASALSLINRYCSTLPSDMATRLRPQYSVEKCDPNNLKSECICTLKLPINSPLRKGIVGERMRKKKLAKISAALKACKELHEMGELNDHLVPISNLVDEALENELGGIIEPEKDFHGAQAGTNRRRRVYEKRVPKFLQNARPVPRQSCYLHVIRLQLIDPLPVILNPRKRPIIDPAASNRDLAILCTSKLPPVNPFPLFTKFGKMMADIVLIDSPLALQNTELEMIREFHRFMFSDVLWLEKGKSFSPQTSPGSYYLVPVIKANHSEIDWSFIKQVKEDVYHQQVNGTSAVVTEFNENKFNDVVLLKSYMRKLWRTERPSFHCVMKIVKDMSPNSVINKKKQTFKTFYEERYNTKITIDEQPLIETVNYSALHFWKPLYLTPKEVYDTLENLSNTKLKRQDFHEYLVPELCIIHPFPASFFLKVICLPTVLFRLHSLLLVEELRQNIAQEMLIGQVYSNAINPWEPFHLETSDKPLRKHLHEKGFLDKVDAATPLVPKDIRKKGVYISSFITIKDPGAILGPSPSLLLQALTAKSAGDEFDLERLEMIGDSFLKYVMTIKIYIKYINFDEGKLSLLRSKLIQNLHLYQKGTKKNLGEFLVTAVFSCDSTWVPPCYDVLETVSEEALIKRSKKKNSGEETSEQEKDNNLHKYFTKKIISDKCIADSVEALIGAYLLSTGPQGALRFMVWLGLKPLVTEEDNFRSWPPAPPSPFHSGISNSQLFSDLTSGYDRFEKSINYKFKNKGYLLQALTHQSYHWNTLTDCYQRLEFLGDAILDYLITRQLYEDPNDHSPGKLTDLRSALVNNSFFASVAVRKGYHKFMHILSPSLHKLITNYIELLTNSEEYKFFEKHGYYLEELECFELAEVEVPKALGDVFESVAGAIYLDSGMSLDAVWEVYFPMIKDTLDHLSQYVPISPVRKLYEMYADLKFEPPISKEGRTYIQVILPDGQSFEGVGPNKKVAKVSAAKRALSELRAQKMDVC